MKIVGLILLILGLVAAGNAMFGKPPKKSGSAAYDKGGDIARVGAPVVLIGLGLGLLLRGSVGSARSTSSRPISAGGIPPRPVAPPIPTTIPVKIYCGCGQHYSFDIEPVAGRMPAPVACPVCGADGTDAANAVIAQTLAARLQSASMAPAPAVGRKSTLRLTLLIAGGVVVMLVTALVVSSLVRSALRRARVRQGVPSNTWPQSGGARGGNPNPGVPQQRGPLNAQTGRPGSKSEAAPVPPGVTAVEVHWGNSWWKATILRRDGQRAFIHYDGWSSSSDEWVTPDRMRPR
jgi:hypothetical protein